MPELTAVQHLAASTVCHLECHPTLNGGWVASLNPKAPEWILDMLRAVHERLDYPSPDPWVYAFTEAACNAITQAENGSIGSAKNAIKADKDPVCLSRWLADDPERRAALCDHVQLREQSHSDYLLLELLKWGQYQERLAVFACVYQQLEAVTTEKANA